MRRTVVTGIGLVSPLGSDLDAFWERIAGGKSGIRRIDKIDPTPFTSQIGGQVIEFDVNDYLERKEQRRVDPFCQFAIGAADLAIKDAGLDLNVLDLERIGVLVGSGIGGLQTLQTQAAIVRDRGPDRCSPFTIPQMISNMASGLIAIRFHLKGPNYSVSSACATANHAFGGAVRIIERNEADLMVAGGAEATLCELGFAGFCALRALSTRNDDPQGASRPFDAERNGFVMSEGGGVLILEELEHARKRGAHIYAELAGWGMTSDANHITAPLEDGSGAARAMELALADAKLTPADIDYINAHGTSTQLNDKTETLAIKTAFGEERARQIMISSSKSMTGHLLGAAGGIEAAVCLLAMQHGVAPPTINQETADPDCDLDYVPNTARETKIRACISNSLGFGGHNACILFKQL